MSLPIESAVQITRERMAEIFIVQEWAKEMKYSSSKYFSGKFRNVFGE